MLDDELCSPGFANADYWFPDDAIVGELKCLTEDLSTNTEFSTLLSSLYAGWVREGLVPRPTSARTTVNLQNLPLACARQITGPMKRKLESTAIKKANKQIRETKQFMSAPSAQGLLFLANDGNHFMPPGMTTHLLSSIFKSQYSSINAIIYFSVNEVAHVPGVPMPANFWIEGVIPGREPVAPAFLGRVRDAWMAHYSTLVPEPVFEFAGKNDVDYLNAVQFKKRGNAA